MIRLVYKALPFFLIVGLMYWGGDWTKATIVQTRDKILTRITAWEMASMDTSLRINAEMKPAILQDFPSFLTNCFPGKTDDLKTDSWGTEYLYQFLRKEKIYELRSAGPDKAFNTEDDLMRTNKNQ